MANRLDKMLGIIENNVILKSKRVAHGKAKASMPTKCMDQMPEPMHTPPMPIQRRRVVTDEENVARWETFSAA